MGELCGLAMITSIFWDIKPLMMKGSPLTPFVTQCSPPVIIQLSLPLSGCAMNFA
jgi:hypothetical protein